MPSVVTEDDVRAAAYVAGITGAHRLNAFMKTVNLYAFALARKMAGVVLEDAAEFEVPEKLYLCRSCGRMKTLDEFPEAKRDAPGKGTSCLHCQDKRLYRCTGLCRQMKPLREFPQSKQDHPHRPSPCSYCAPKTIVFRQVLSPGKTS